MTLATAAKVAATVLTNDKLRKTVGWIIAAVLSPLIVLMVIVFSFMSGGADHNAAVLDLCYYGGTIAGSVPGAYRQHIMDMQNSLTVVDSEIAAVNSMAEDGNGLDSNRVKAVFYSLYFGEDNPSAVGTVKFVDCFVRYEERTDTWTDDDGTEHTDTYTVAVPVSLETAYANIQAVMGVEITEAVRKNVTEIYTRTSSGGDTFSGGYLRGDGTRIELDISAFANPTTKNNLDLVIYAENAWRNGWGYVWGTYGSVLTDSLFASKLAQYPDGVGNYEDFIRSNWLGGRTTDCVGLIKGYGWLDTEAMSIGYSDSKPTLEKLVVTMFVTYADKYIQKELPKGWQSFVSYKSGNIIAFLDSLMNNVLYRERYDALSAHVAAGLNVTTALERYAPETLVECDSFAQIDSVILHWLTARLLAEDTGAKLGNHPIPEICEMRRKMHFGETFAAAYELLKSAYALIMVAQYKCPEGFKAIIKQYQTADYEIDAQYRHFYYCCDQLENTGDFEKLRDLVENIYTNEYLGKQLPAWNAALMEPDALTVLPLQRNFFARYVKNNKDRTAVIISDAMRYEVGRQLLNKLLDDPKCTAKMECMLSTLPSYTRLGMAALLPHSTLELTDDGKELADGVYCMDLNTHQSVLQKAAPESCCVQFDAIKNMKKAALRDVFTGKQVVYIYHDQIDVRGEHTEDEVFAACEEAVAEIADLIRKIALNANTLHFIVTADHGFIYKRDKVTESDKIGGVSGSNSIVKRRYIVSHQPVQEDGVCSLGLGYLLGNQDDKIISFPCSTSVFKTPGSGGQNYVHGGSSPQEMLIPVLDAKMEKGHMETRTVQIALVSLVQKITNLITTLDFIQSDAVSDVVKGTTFRLYFISEDNEKISNENIYVADKRDADAQKRIFRMRFTFKNKKYDKDKPYYLVASDDASGVEAFRHAVVMDLPFANDFGFGR